MKRDTGVVQRKELQLVCQRPARVGEKADGTEKEERTQTTLIIGGRLEQGKKRDRAKRKGVIYRYVAGGM